MNDAKVQACADIGIVPPKTRAYGRWLVTDTLEGKRGKGDGRVIVNERHVTAWNWQTGVSVTVGMGEASSRIENHHVADQVDAARARQEGRARQAASIAHALVEAAQSARHPYLSGKGFNNETVLVIDSDYIRDHAGGYLIPEGGLFLLKKSSAGPGPAPQPPGMPSHGQINPPPRPTLRMAILLQSVR